ncbi:hypothetical protein GCM10018772_15110 [Streptomyces fumanus]|uniref:Uncharacterized protein n=1 Tax=Streptomyces fumanus TaxID=67302 RepID=A0A919DYP0_9ACTN|nr:hypothetical protein GCM10018772_15110 [Streptomyces fumanus]
MAAAEADISVERVRTPTVITTYGRRNVLRCVTAEAFLVAMGPGARTRRR